MTIPSGPGALGSTVGSEDPTTEPIVNSSFDKSTPLPAGGVYGHAKLSSIMGIESTGCEDVDRAPSVSNPNRAGKLDLSNGSPADQHSGYTSAQAHSACLPSLP